VTTAGPRQSIVAEGLGKRYVLKSAPLPRSLSDLRHRRATAEERGHWALRDVSFSVEEGTTVGIIGRNGAGKTTLLKVLTGVTLPTEGRAEMRGRVVPLLAVGAGFHPDASGRQNIRLNAAFLGLPAGEIDRRMDTIVDFAEVDPAQLDLPVRLYDGNTYVRLAFAAAVVLEPDILLADEILAAGDATFRERALEQMAEAAPSQTVVFVSHDLSAVLRLCTRVLWLHDGRILGDGEPNEIVEAYKASVNRGRSAGRHVAHGPRSSGAVALDRIETGATAVTHDSPGRIAVHWRALEPGLRVRVSAALMIGDLPAVRGESPEIVVDEAGLRCTRVAPPAGILARSRYRVAITVAATRDGEPAGEASGDAWLVVSHADRGTASRPALAEPDLTWSAEPAPAAAP
jgi:ABC-type polysaccharide/polyol phosphate transport system ATPase subunit